MTHKTCTKCDECKALTDYSKDARGKGGRRAVCKLCVADYHADYQSANREHLDAYRRANRGKQAARKVLYRQPDSLFLSVEISNQAARKVLYRQSNPHTGWVSDYRKRCRKVGLIPIVVPFTKDDVVARYGDSCHYCADGAFEHLDHHVPVAAGGTHTIGNVRPACANCNLRKRNSSDQSLIDTKRGKELG